MNQIQNQTKKPMQDVSYDEDGYDVNGYDRDGYNKYGWDQDGYDEDGYDKEGFDKDGRKRPEHRGSLFVAIGRSLNSLESKA